MEALTRFGTYDPMCGNGKGVSVFSRSLPLPLPHCDSGRKREERGLRYPLRPRLRSFPFLHSRTNQPTFTFPLSSIRRPTVIPSAFRPFPYDQASRCSRSSRAPLSPSLGAWRGKCIIFSFRAAPPLPFPSLRRHSSAIDRQGRWTTFLRSFYAAYKAEAASVARRGVMGL